eukprot:6768121-Pyramimonas_sp.AAC.1
MLDLRLPSTDLLINQTCVSSGKLRPDVQVNLRRSLQHVGDSTFYCMRVLPKIGQRLRTHRPNVLCLPEHVSVNFGALSLAKSPMVANDGGGGEGDGGEGEDVFGDDELSAYPVQVIVRAVQLSFLMHNPDDATQIIRLAASFALAEG